MLEIGAYVVSLIGLAVTLYFVVKKKPIGLFVGFFVLVIGIVAIFVPLVHLEITQPLSNTTVDCESITEEGQCAITVRVRISGIIGKIQES